LSTADAEIVRQIVNKVVNKIPTKLSTGAVENYLWEKVLRNGIKCSIFAAEKSKVQK